MDASQAYTLRKKKRKKKKEKRRERSFGIRTGHNTAGNVRPLVANHVKEFKNSYSWTY